MTVEPPLYLYFVCDDPFEVSGPLPFRFDRANKAITSLRLR